MVSSVEPLSEPDGAQLRNRVSDAGISTAGAKPAARRSVSGAECRTEIGAML